MKTIPSEIIIDRMNIIREKRSNTFVNLAFDVLEDYLAGSKIVDKVLFWREIDALQDRKHNFYNSALLELKNELNRYLKENKA